MCSSPLSQQQQEVALQLLMADAAAGQLGSWALLALDQQCCGHHHHQLLLLLPLLLLLSVRPAPPP